MNDLTVENKSEESEQYPGVLKTTEFELMLRLVKLGLWRTMNLAKSCGVDPDTITKWKRRDEAKQAYRQAIEKVLKKRYNTTDPEKLMRELDLEVDMSPSSLTQNNIYLGLNDEQLDKLIESKIQQVGIGLPARGETASDEARSDEVREAA